MPAPDLKTRLLRVWKDRPRRCQLVVTDITRMEGSRVCVAGFLDDGRVVRPVCGRRGPTEAWLRPAPDSPVLPFTILELKVQRAPKPLLAPHVEDRLVPEAGHRVRGALSPWERIAWLESSLSPSVRDIFGTTVHADAAASWGRYVRSGEGTRSLGTIRSSQVEAVRYHYYPDRGRWDYRLRFRDATGEAFQLAVVDLAYRQRLDDLRRQDRLPDRVAAETLETLRQQSTYLRLGLSRGWDRHPDRCYLQITGVYGFGL